MKFPEAFESFLRTEVNLNKTRLDRLEASIQAIDTFVQGNAVFGSLFLDAIPAGSWAHRTIIKPVQENDEFDADVLLHLAPHAEWQPKDYIENLFAELQAHGTYRDKVEEHTRCVRIDYAGDFHVDVVPYMEIGGLHYVTNRKTDKHEQSNPEAFNAWIEERQLATQGYFIKVVRLLKYLRDYKNTFSCKSIILTTLLGERISAVEAFLSPVLFADLPTALDTFLARLVEYLPETMPEVVDPAGTGDIFTDRYKDSWNYENFRKMMTSYSAQVSAAIAESDEATSIAMWQAIFGSKFDPAMLTDVRQLSPLSARTPASKEQFIDRTYGFPIQLDRRHSVKIKARCVGYSGGVGVRRNGYPQFGLADRGNRVSKNRSLDFRATTDVAEPYALYWKVRNGGQEAAHAGQLRGEITQDAGNNIKTETTSFAGTHYVECYVVKDKRVVAKAHQTVIVNAGSR